MSDNVTYRPRPSSRSMWIRFWLWVAFVGFVEVLLGEGLMAWWGEDARGWAIAVVLTVCIVLLLVGGYALDAVQRRDLWEVDE